MGDEEGSGEGKKGGSSTGSRYALLSLEFSEVLCLSYAKIFQIFSGHFSSELPLQLKQ